MAGAVSTPSPLNLVSGADFSVDLQTAVLDPVSTRPLHVVGMNVGVRGTLTDPRPVVLQKEGGVAPVHGLSLIHI